MIASFLLVVGEFAGVFVFERMRVMVYLWPVILDPEALNVFSLTEPIADAV